jgi:hypothetical protein
VEWNDLVEDTDKWQALVKVVMNLRVPKKCEEFLDSCETQLYRMDSASWK